MKKYKRILLLGFRATGKTTLAKKLAEVLGWKTIDTDQEIVRQTGRSLGELTKGGTDWLKFRQLDNELLGKLIEEENIVISCGGGTGVNDFIDLESGKTFGHLNKEILKDAKESLLILLDADENIIADRMLEQYKTHKNLRPFLNPEKAKEVDGGRLKVDDQINDSLEAYRKRRPLYQKLTDFKIDTGKLNIDQSLCQILNYLGYTVCMSMGYPNKHSRSPSLHNVGYNELGLKDQFIYLKMEVKPEDLKKAMEAVKTLGIRGVSVTMPHKREVIKYLNELDPDAKVIGAVNTVVNDNGKLTGFNTDWIGAIKSLEEKTSLKDKKVAVLGAGGAARAIIFGLTKKEARVVIFNRTFEKAKELAREFGCEVGDFNNPQNLENMDIIINATPIGMKGDKSPIDKKFINKNQIVFDVIYLPIETRFLKDAKEKGAEVIPGYEMLLYQAVEQFKLYTGFNAPVAKMKSGLIASLY